uniref:Uncharacterized protein n=1 Tax=Panagrolaimus superbus TaxID=310955 RepID=A0A914Y3E2_9BILA
MERKRKEMMENANWRSENRKEIIEKTHEMLKKEFEESQAHIQAGPSFIRPMIQSAMDNQTLEDSINHRRKRAAGSSRDMQKSFARR